MAAPDLAQQLADLREARASGARRVRTSVNSVETEVEYRTDGELAAAIADLERRIALQTARPVHTVKIFSSKGV